MSNFKKRLSVFAAMLALVSITGTSMALDLSKDNIKGQTGNASLSTGIDGIKHIDVTGGKQGAVAQVDFSKYNLDKGEHVDYGFSAKSQTMINRVLGGEQSKIFGKMTNSGVGKDTGRVILINPAGVMFGAGSTVDLNSFTVSTFDFNGAKNLQDLSAEDITKYQSELTDKFSKEGISFNVSNGQLIGKDGIIIQDKANIFADKQLNFITDGNIKYKDSIIKTNGYMNVITSDGVIFEQAATDDGGLYNPNILSKGDKLTTDKYGNIVITNSTLESVDMDIYSANGNVKADKSILNNSIANINADNGYVNFSNTTVNNGTDGYININSKENTNIENNSNINSQDISIVSQKGNVNILRNSNLNGGINLTSKEGFVNVKDSNLNATGTMTLVRNDNGNTEISNTMHGKLEVPQAIEINSAKSATIENSKLDAGMGVYVQSKEHIRVSNSNINSSNDIELVASKGGLNSQAQSADDGKAVGNIILEHSNLKSDNGDIIAKTYNGKISLYNTKADAKQNFEVNSNGSVFIQNGSEIKGTNINVTSEKGNVNVLSGSDLDSETISLTSKEGFVNVKNSKLTGIEDVESKYPSNGEYVGIVAPSGFVEISANKSATVENSSIQSDDINITSNEHVRLTESEVQAPFRSLKITASNDAKAIGNIKIENSNIGDATLQTFNGSVTVDNSKVDSDIQIDSTGYINIINKSDFYNSENSSSTQNTYLHSTNGNINISGNTDIKADDVFVAADNGNINIKHANISALKNIDIQANNKVTFEDSKLNTENGNVNITSENKDVEFLPVHSEVKSGKDININAENGRYINVEGLSAVSFEAPNGELNIKQKNEKNNQ